MRFVPLSAFLFLSSTAAFASGVTDRAGFFSDGAKATALSTIQEITSQTHEDITVDVYDRAPSNQFVGWAVAHAPASGGIYMVISRNPGHAEVVVKNSSHFSSSDRQRISDILLSGFRNKNFDGGLVDSLRYAASVVAPRPVAVAAPIVQPQPVVVAAATATLPQPQTAIATPAKKSSGVSWLWWLVLLPLVGWGLYKMWQSLNATSDEEEDEDAKEDAIAGRRVNVQPGVSVKSKTTPPEATPPVQQSAPQAQTSHVIINTVSQQPSGGGFVAGLATGFAVDALSRSADLERDRLETERRMRRREREEEESQTRREEERRAAARQRDEEEERRRRDQAAASSSYDSGSSSSGGSFDSGSSGGSFDSGSSGGGFDSGSSGGGSSGGDF